MQLHTHARMGTRQASQQAFESMDPLLMPSEVKGTAGAPASPDRAPDDLSQAVVVEPPSVKLIVRLFLIPLAIVAVAVGVMFLIGLLAGGQPSVEEAMANLKNPGGGRTAEWLVGPGAKQRYIDAKTITDHMKLGMTPPERIRMADQLIDLLDHYTSDNEGEVRHFLLLALGRVWQVQDPPPPSAELDQSSEAKASRQKVMQALLRYAGSKDIQTRKAAILALAYWAGREEVRQAMPMLLGTVRDQGADLDVRLAAATVLGPLGNADPQVLDALGYAMRDTDKRNIELVWAAALSLAQLNQPQVSDIILQLLDRRALSEFEYYDRETDPKNPSFRKLNEQEQQRILINTMLGARKLDVPAVRQRLRDLAQNDPSPRVREAGIEVLASLDRH